MVLEIRLTNFFSIKDEVVLDFRAAKLNTAKSRALTKNIFSYDNIEVLKTISIYGANASGKSNIVKAIRFCHRMVFHSHTHNENTIFNFSPYRFYPSSSLPSVYFIRFVIDGIEYEYSFSLTQKEIVAESLYYYPHKRRAKVFERNEKGGTKKKDKYKFQGSLIKRPFDVAENTSNKTLFISRASQLDREIPKKIFLFFHETFILDYASYSASHMDEMIKRYKSQLLKGLQLADSDIIDFTHRKDQKEGKNVTTNFITGETTFKNVPIDNIYIYTYHKHNPKIQFNLLEESAGTISLFFILLTIFEIVKEHKVLLVDEIETSLHPKIVEYIIEIFHTSERSQLIFTTHNTNLLDLDKFRKDQVWFVNKLKDGSSDLYSLYDYSDFRDTMDLEKAYLQGRFDAVPIVDDSHDKILSIISD